MKVREVETPELIMMVGAPATGKTTMIDQLLQNNPEKDYVVLSTDDIFMVLGAEKGLTYNQAFKSIPFKKVNSKFFNDLRQAINARRNIIIDQTNMSKKARAKKLNLFSNDYKKIAYVFQVNRDELDRRLADRSEKEGKSIPSQVVDQMLGNFQMPGRDEFDEVHNV